MRGGDCDARSSSLLSPSSVFNVGRGLNWEDIGVEESLLGDEAKGRGMTMEGMVRRATEWM
eukprot:CAMPEP_0182491530 /NCGR_PEP_ID=MMETSP1321-20130603/931_1 /TAXON_ID=91990 /ORGANISM="Bolidomonas sp., Strain RCC1657" /LENGTH=60 /DNA_ID=CAMNT_0024693811 /DNA_START=946 /DNA_END=1128 /DNA_ORIENTATION=+